MESEHQHLVHVVLYNMTKLEKIEFDYRTTRERKQYIFCRFLLDKLNINEPRPLQSYTTIELLRIKIALISYDSTLADDQKKPLKELRKYHTKEAKRSLNFVREEYTKNENLRVKIDKILEQRS